MQKKHRQARKTKQDKRGSARSVRVHGYIARTLELDQISLHDQSHNRGVLFLNAGGDRRQAPTFLGAGDR